MKYLLTFSLVSASFNFRISAAWLVYLRFNSYNVRKNTSRNGLTCRSCNDADYNRLEPLAYLPKHRLLWMSCKSNQNERINDGQVASEHTSISLTLAFSSSLRALLWLLSNWAFSAMCSIVSLVSRIGKAHHKLQPSGASKLHNIFFNPAGQEIISPRAWLITYSSRKW